MRRNSRRFPGPAVIGALATLALAGALLTPGCSEDPTGPVPDQVIKIWDTTFNPNSVRVKAGSLIEWENHSQQARTVTSGDSANASDAGVLFDANLAGYASGHAVGGTFQYRFVAPDTITYFSRLVPGDYKPTSKSFGGTIYIVP
jgi:plastocyanin